MSAYKQSEKETQDLLKVRYNITEVLYNSNATPLKGHDPAGYDCCFCENKFHTPALLKQHILDEHDSIKSDITKKKPLGTLLVKLDTTGLQCSLCLQEIYALEDLMVHLNTVHEKSIFLDVKNQIYPFKFDTEKFKCCICFKEHKNFRSLCLHMSVHYRNYVCKVCNAGFANRHGLVSHLMTHKTDTKYTCTYCPKVFDTQRKIHMHERSVHTHSNLLNRCGHCHKYFRNYAKKVKHVAIVHGVGSVNAKCSMCPKSFSAVTTLATHMKSAHSTEPKHACSRCDQKFVSQDELRKHSVEHTGQQKFQCKVCFKSYRKKFNLQEHMRSHEGRNFKCGICRRGFIHKCSLKRHKCFPHSGFLKDEYQDDQAVSQQEEIFQDSDSEGATLEAKETYIPQANEEGLKGSEKLPKTATSTDAKKF